MVSDVSDPLASDVSDPLVSDVSDPLVSDVSDPFPEQGADRIEVTARSRSVQPGELVVLAITLFSPAQRVRVRAFERDMPCFALAAATGEAPEWQALIGIDLDVKPGTHPVAIDADN